MKNNFAVVLALAAILIYPAMAQQQIQIKAPEANPVENVSSVFKIPFKILFRLIYSIGELPIWIIRGFLSVWSSWGFPPISDLLASISTSAPAVFRDSMFILLFFCMIEFVVLLLVPIVGWLFIPVAWGFTGIGTLLYAIADFISLAARSSQKRGGMAGWIG